MGVFEEVMKKSAERFGETHLLAHLRLTDTLYTRSGINLQELSDYERTLVACAVLATLEAVAPQIKEKS